MPGRDAYQSYMKDMDSDVASLKALLMEKVGPDWQSVCQCRMWQNFQPPCPQLIDSRAQTPWDEVHATMTRRGNDSVPAFIASTVKRLTSSYYSWR